LTITGGQPVTVKIYEGDDTLVQHQMPLIQQAIDAKVNAIDVAVTNGDAQACLANGTYTPCPATVAAGIGSCDDMGTCTTCTADQTSNATTITKLIDKATDAGIKVLTWDGDAPKSKRLTYYGMDQYQSGKTVADLFNKLLGGTGKIIIVSPAFNP